MVHTGRHSTADFFRRETDNRLISKYLKAGDIVKTSQENDDVVVYRQRVAVTRVSQRNENRGTSVVLRVCQSY